MTEIINLNKKRKARARTQKEKTASENRIKFGRTKQEKTIGQRNAKSAEQRLAGHKIETEENE